MANLHFKRFAFPALSGFYFEALSRQLSKRALEDEAKVRFTLAFLRNPRARSTKAKRVEEISFLPASLMARAQASASRPLSLIHLLAVWL